MVTSTKAPGAAARPAKGLRLSLWIAQVILALRNEVAQAAKVPLREVSLPLLIRWAPELARDGQDPVATLARYGRNAGIIRPFRGRTYDLPRVRPGATACIVVPLGSLVAPL